MLKPILAIAGKPGLYKLVSQGKNMLIVEALATGKRMPAYAHDKVISLGDISIYTTDEDVSLSTVLDALKTKAESQPVDIKALGSDANIRAYFKEVLPEFDDERVYTNDIKKVLSWYNLLLAAGITDYADSLAKGPRAEDEAQEKQAE